MMEEKAHREDAEIRAEPRRRSKMINPGAGQRIAGPRVCRDHTDEMNEPRGADKTCVSRQPPEMRHPHSGAAVSVYRTVHRS